jgi:hypothetical protein
VVAVLAFAVMLLCHWMMVRVTRNWSLAVQGIVNLGRKKLAETLGLQLPTSLAAEKHMWGYLTVFVFYGRNGERLDLYRKRAEAALDGHAVRAAGDVGDDVDDTDDPNGRDDG